MKHFEDEYNQYMHRETPDLWDRIEKALPEKSPGNDGRETVVEFPQKETYRREGSRRRILTGMAAAAAGICIILTASVTMKIRNDSEKSAAEAFRSSEKSKDYETEMNSAAEESKSADEAFYAAAEEFNSAAEASYAAAEESESAAEEFDSADEALYAAAEESDSADEAFYAAAEESAPEPVYIADDALMFYAPEEYSVDSAINRFPFTASVQGGTEQAEIVTETAVCPWNPDHTLILALITGGETVSDITLEAGMAGGIRCLNSEDPEETVYQTVLRPGETRAVLFEQKMPADEAASLIFTVSDPEKSGEDEFAGDTAGARTILPPESGPIEEAGENMIQASAACELALLERDEAEPGMSRDNARFLLESLSPGNEAREMLLETEDR